MFVDFLCIRYWGTLGPISPTLNCNIELKFFKAICKEKLITYYNYIKLSIFHIIIKM